MTAITRRSWSGQRADGRVRAFESLNLECRSLACHQPAIPHQHLVPKGILLCQQLSLSFSVSFPSPFLLAIQDRERGKLDEDGQGVLSVRRRTSTVYVADITGLLFIKSRAVKKIPESKPGMTKSKGCSPTQPVALSYFVYRARLKGSGQVW